MPVCNDCISIFHASVFCMYTCIYARIDRTRSFRGGGNTRMDNLNMPSYDENEYARQDAVAALISLCD
jgi:hypothetical protein